MLFRLFKNFLFWFCRQWAHIFDHKNLIIIRFLELSDYSSTHVERAMWYNSDNGNLVIRNRIHTPGQLRACRIVDLVYLVLLSGSCGKKKKYYSGFCFWWCKQFPVIQRQTYGGSWSAVSLLQSLTTSRPSSGVRLCCCRDQRLWGLWVIGGLSADWRPSVSECTAPCSLRLCLSLYLPPQLCVVAPFFSLLNLGNILSSSGQNYKWLCVLKFEYWLSWGQLLWFIANAILKCPNPGKKN